MKNAKKFREAFKDKDVAFVYLSLDKSKNAWVKASNNSKRSFFHHEFFLFMEFPH